MLRSRYDFDTIWRADNDTRFTSRTSLLIDDRELSRLTLANRLTRHTHRLGHLLWDMTSSCVRLAAALSTDFGEDLMSDLLIIDLPF